MRVGLFAARYSLPQADKRCHFNMHVWVSKNGWSEVVLAISEPGRFAVRALVRLFLFRLDLGFLVFEGS